METTDPKSASVSYKTNWLRFRADRNISPGRVWLFTDGSTTGWHAAALVVPGQYARTVAREAPFHPSRNIAGELNGYLLGLEIVPTDTLVSVVHDFIGVGAWTIGAWDINTEIVKEKISQALKTIAEKNLTVEFIHHAGHQNKKKKDRPICHSDFTKWNCTVDRLCEGKVVIDTVTSLVTP